MKRFEGKVVFVTGVARGQARQHAVRFAREGAHIVGLDLADDISTVHYPSASRADLDETARLIETEGGKHVLHQGDVRDQAAIDKAVQDGLERFGRIDIVLPMAGITSLGALWELSDEQWNEMIGINLTGVWRTLRATIPHVIAGESGGSIVLTGSIAGLMGMPYLGHYTASKHGINGIMRSLANELAPHAIRVNSVNPTNVATPMIHNDATYQHFCPDVHGATQQDAIPVFQSYNLLQTPWIEPDDVSNAVLWLCSEEARYLTGVALPVDTGTTVKWPGN
ncbi:mycofactocin-coupled SDR family oxidoreductase [Saccharopolyspora mangrovi]|uniref:Mycofactocin-coupled SDR family oxidoreductase n=1 Tax=Saccharopolyspora mangrovi TaxID=3082379 RepID=A0ABU6AK88_9PSEU|nr:mycofactocin-coupled SDR family oxidoreductase [Saccharopolyspora sp. S2-29]MEB3371730.1 mycofactocin-coupled SDR family oxidoreductase [Saccharopolyspora sp. S2-29]